MDEAAAQAEMEIDSLPPELDEIEIVRSCSWKFEREHRKRKIKDKEVGTPARES